MLEPGRKGRADTVVTPANTAKTMGSGTLEVFATPAMAALVEQAAYTSVAEDLEPGWGSVGTQLNLEHLAATPLGMKVTAETVLEEVDARRLVFSARIYDEAGLIGRGTHTRVLVEEARFLAKAQAKKN